MAGLLYFFPRVEPAQMRAGNRLSSAFLERFGLAASLGDIRDLEKEASLFHLPTKGPGDESGTILIALTGGAAPPRIGYYPDFQTWHEVLADPRLWIGVDNEHPPTETDLRRPTTLPGWPVTLADGGEYTIPYVRSPVRQTALPQDLFHGPDGLLRMEVKRQWLPLWERTAVAWDMCTDPETKIPFSQILDHCLAYVGVNYRYGPREQAALRLVDTANWQDVFAAVVDLPFAAQLAEQKKTADTSPA